MAQLVLLLRGINIGPRRRIAMPDLRELLEGELGYANARTYVQSGNAIVETSDKPDKVASDVERAIERVLGHDVPTVVRTARQMHAIEKHNPLAAVAKDFKRYAVLFCSDTPNAAAVNAARTVDFGDEHWGVKGKEIYAFYPAGTQQSRVLKALTEAKLKTTITSRNWNTVLALNAMLRER